MEKRKLRRVQKILVPPAEFTQMTKNGRLVVRYSASEDPGSDGMTFRLTLPDAASHLADDFDVCVMGIALSLFEAAGDLGGLGFFGSMKNYSAAWRFICVMGSELSDKLDFPPYRELGDDN